MAHMASSDVADVTRSAAPLAGISGAPVDTQKASTSAGRLLGSYSS
jgi:hypothetical protein